MPSASTLAVPAGTTAAEDEARAKSAREQGRLFLNQLRERALAAGAARVDVRWQRHGALEDTVVEQAQGVRLLALGRRGAGAEAARRWAIMSSIWFAPESPHPDRDRRLQGAPTVMIAFDGGTVTRRGVEMVAAARCRGLPILLLMSGKQAETHPNRLIGPGTP